ncbi:0ec05fff-e761-4394-9be4-d1f54537e0f7 [Thermothielavioides terrestris]|uniref:0ec05fff-e761-4394-9be4-d1f54537e0f7 n=1 Tax=Thermothielavioides terrestris TaxID=2587410 RepID=A0A446BI83_9PEZI|nr:0ec05fff-e761-4394-9be4-d1f54537e0f7 [Thermothielavioides terrestris]
MRQTAETKMKRFRAELLAELKVVYGQLAAFSKARDTGLLNSLLHLLPGAVPPFSDLFESVRALLVGDSDSVTVLDQLALAIGVITASHTATVTVQGNGAAAQSLTATQFSPEGLPSQSFPHLTLGIALPNANTSLATSLSASISGEVFLAL